MEREFKEFIVVQPVPSNYGTLPVGTVIIKNGDIITVNGGMIDNNFYDLFKNFIDEEIKSPYYLKEDYSTTQKRVDI